MRSVSPVVFVTFVTFVTFVACGKGGSKEESTTGTKHMDLGLVVTPKGISPLGETVDFEVKANQQVTVTLLGVEGHLVGGDFTVQYINVPQDKFAPGKQTLVVTAEYIDAKNMGYFTDEKSFEYDFHASTPMLTFAQNGYEALPTTVKYMTELGSSEGKCTFASGDQCMSDVRGPAGTKLTVAGTEYAITPDGAAVGLPVPLDKLGETPRKGEPEPLTLEVVVNDAKATLTMERGSILSALFSRVRPGKPVLFPGEAARGGRHSIWFGGPVYGEAATYADVDAIATAGTVEKRLSPCRYEGGFTRTRVEIDTVAKIIERRTGKVVAEKTFKPKTACSSVAVAQGGSTGDVDRATVEDGVVTAWIRSQIR